MSAVRTSAVRTSAVRTSALQRLPRATRLRLSHRNTACELGGEAEMLSVIAAAAIAVSVAVVAATVAVPTTDSMAAAVASAVAIAVAVGAIAFDIAHAFVAHAVAVLFMTGRRSQTTVAPGLVAATVAVAPLRRFSKFIDSIPTRAAGAVAMARDALAMARDAVGGGAVATAVSDTIASASRGSPRVSSTLNALAACKGAGGTNALVKREWRAGPCGLRLHTESHC
eukprot:6205746-Pleurochrysis_carterae.AAC.1